MSDICQLKIPASASRISFIKRIFKYNGNCNEFKKNYLSQACVKDKDTRMGIYVILNTKTNDFYIGSTKNFHKRKLAHLFKLRTNQRTSKKLKSAYDMAGEVNFWFLVIQSVPNEQMLADVEQFWIELLKPSYNTNKKITRLQHTEEGRRKIGEHARVHNALKGWKAVLQYDKAGNFIKEWPSIQHVERELGINNSHISQNCRGSKTYKSAGGFVWKYKPQLNESIINHNDPYDTESARTIQKTIH